MLLISDLDGTAIDSINLIIASYEHVISTYNLKPRSRVELRSCVGIALRELYSSWASHQSECEKMYETHRSFQTQNGQLVKPIIGIPEAFRTLKEKGVKIAINTNRSASTKEFLELSGLAPFIDYVVCCNDVTHPKPHGEGLVKTMSHFGISREKTWMFGDTAIDILAGQHAGVHTIAAAFESNETELAVYKPDHIITAPSQLLDIISI